MNLTSTPKPPQSTENDPYPAWRLALVDEVQEHGGERERDGGRSPGSLPSLYQYPLGRRLHHILVHHNLHQRTS